MIDILFDKDNTRAIAVDNTTIIGECNYTIVNNDTWNIYHTEVDSSYTGKGIARQLVECIITNASDSNVKLTSSCSYASKILNEN